MNEQEVRGLLDDLADTPAPPPRVDVSRAVSVARRQARVRTWATTAAASVLVVGLAVGVNYAVTGGSPAPESGTAATVASAPERFDPLVEYAEFGWLPEESRMNSSFTWVNDAAFSTGVREYVPDPSKGPMASRPAASVSVAFYAASGKPQSELPLDVWGPTDPTPTVPYAPVTDAPAVNGAPAYWVTVPGEPETIILKWRYAPNAWAELTVSRLDGDLRHIAHRVASDMRVGGTERLRFPFHLTGLPAGLHPVSSTFAEGGLDAPWRVELTFSTGDDRRTNVEVSVHPMSGADTRDSNTIVDGHQAHRDIVVGDSGEQRVVGAEWADMLRVYDDPAGFLTYIQADAKTVADAEPLGPDGALGLYRGLTLYPDPADWTDRPLR